MGMFFTVTEIPESSSVSYFTLQASIFKRFREDFVWSADAHWSTARGTTVAIEKTYQKVKSTSSCEKVQSVFSRDL